MKRRAEYDIIEPIGKRVVVRKDDNKRETKSGIVLPDSLQCADGQRTKRGRVQHFHISPRTPVSFRRRAGILDDLAPFCNFRFDERREFFRRITGGFGALGE